MLPELSRRKVGRAFLGKIKNKMLLQIVNVRPFKEKGSIQNPYTNQKLIFIPFN